MQVYAPNSMTSMTAAPPARRGATSTFTVAAEAPQAAAASGPVSTLAGIGMLLALQGFEDATERRKRVVRRARSALDALEALKLGLLAGRIEPAMLLRLQALAEEIGTDTGDSGLDEALAAIALRARVELAKAGIAPSIAA
jgi:hypothetical protein